MHAPISGKRTGTADTTWIEAIECGCLAEGIVRERDRGATTVSPLLLRLLLRPPPRKGMLGTPPWRPPGSKRRNRLWSPRIGGQNK